MPMNYEQYQKEIEADVAEILQQASCQPILFVGSGFTRRYASGPNWEELLTRLADGCPLINKNFAYYTQTYKDDLKKIGSVFSDLYREWAWTDEGRKHFPEEYFTADATGDIFIKHAIAELLDGLGPKDGSYGSPALDEEIEALRKINAHAIITTNYDEVIEPLFPDYERIVGQQILRKPYLAIGEIFKIHGCRSVPKSIIINEADYEQFEEGHKYLSAKLLTYFVEHPLLFVGYRADDPNIKSILYDVDRMVRADFQLVPNIYILEWDSSITEASYPARDKVISVGSDLNIRIKSITADSFKWVFDAFGQAGDLEKINTKLLRSLLARSVELVRSNIPKKHVEIDFQTLEHAVESGDTFAKLFGVTTLNDPSQVNLNYKYVLSGVAEQLGYNHWTHVQKLVDKLRHDSGFDIKGSDNRYHIAVPAGKTTHIHRYSEAAVTLLRKIQQGDQYELDLQPVKLEDVVAT